LQPLAEVIRIPLPRDHARSPEVETSIFSNENFKVDLPRVSESQLLYRQAESYHQTNSVLYEKRAINIAPAMDLIPFVK
jgi:hypothetical protein